jgi:cbb3-type cytochrome oxidase subunit 3
MKRIVKRLLQVQALLAIAAVLTLIGLALMLWSMLEPTPMPVILAMSVGQGLGIFAFLLFGVAVLLDQFRKHREKGAQEAARKLLPRPGDANDALHVAADSPPAPLHDAAGSAGNAPHASRRGAPP